MAPTPSFQINEAINLKDHIREVPDFPKKDILFYDISTLLANPTAWRYCMDEMADRIQKHQPDLLVGIESRGFLTAAPIADRLGLGFVMVRKKGKLPGDVISHDYELEYGTDTLEIQPDILTKGARVVIMDDLLATGGTMAATLDLLRQADANPVSAQFIIELSFLKGREKLTNIICESSVIYDQ